MSASSAEGGGLGQGIVGPSRIIAFGMGIVAPAGSVVGGLVIVVSYGGFASPLVILITFVASLCCANSVAEFARRVPSAGWAYTYNSRGLGRTAGFLTGWMMILAYALFVPAGIALTSTYASLLLGSVLSLTVAPWALFIVILAAVVLIAYLGIRASSSADLVLVAGEVAVIAALAITILVKIGPAHYSAAAFSPASSPHGQITDITNGMIYAITAFAGFEAAAALGEEARNTRRTVPAGIFGVVIVTGVFFLLVICAETFGAGRDGISGFVQQASPLGYLTSRYWSPAVLWVIELVIVLTGLSFVIATVNAAIRVLFAMGREGALPRSLTRLSGRHTPIVAIGFMAVVTLLLGLPLTYAYGGARTFGYLAGIAGLAVVLIYMTVNLAVIRTFRTEFRDEFRLGRHLLIPATATALFLFPLWGILHPHDYTLMNLLPFTALGWLCIGVIAAGVLRARRPATFAALGSIFTAADDNQRAESARSIQADD